MSSVAGQSSRNMSSEWESCDQTHQKNFYSSERVLNGEYDVLSVKVIQQIICVW